MEHYSPLRYPGGKGKIADYFKQIIKKNSLYDGIYVEPYAGGAAVALSLLFNEYVSKIIINDIDKSIYAFWHSIINRTNDFCKLIEITPITINEWKKQKKVQSNKEKEILLKLGFSTFFLNRTNRSGIINAGVIGGLYQTGKWKIDARYNKQDLINRIKKISLYKDRIIIYNKDATKLIRTLRKSLHSSKVIFYFDPPYYIKGKDLYLNYYENRDHNEISTEIKKIENKKWIITYDNVNYIRELYKNYRKRKFSINYSAGKNNRGEEIMIFSDNLKLVNIPLTMST